MTPLILFALFFLGAISASFIGVVAERAYTGQSFARGRSRCNACRATLHARDLVPVLTWLVHGGRCRRCGSRVPAQYALAEAALGTVFVLGYLHYGATPALVAFLSTMLVLTFVVLYDLRHTVVPSFASALLLAGCIVVAALTASSLTALGITLATAAVIALGFFLLHVCSRGRAMGLGDAPVALALSILAGSQALPGLLFSFWIGALFGIALLSVRRGGPRMGIEVPFVPFLALGYLLALFTTWNPLSIVVG